MRVRVHPLIVVFLTLPSLATAAPASRSAAVAGKLVAAMNQAGVTAVAAQDPGEAGRYVAALLYPGQLLVVSARYPVPPALDARLERHEDRDVYMDLQGAAAIEGRFFLQDMGADGLTPPGAAAAVDIVYENGVTRTAFDGDWQGQRLGQREYELRYRDADARYAALLSVLLARLEGGR